jgi:glutamine amidotransferase
MRVTIIDYGAGNLHSIAKALTLVGGKVSIETDARKAIDTDFLVLPGVGAFGSAAASLAPGVGRIRDAIAGGLPTLGICLGMQLLFESSDEGAGEGLGILKGRATKLDAQRSPQIGWNTIDGSRDPAVARANLKTAYYANGFACRPADTTVVTAWSSHEADRFPAVVRRGAVVGVQFHPEKSSTQGLAFLRAVLGMVS